MPEHKIIFTPSQRETSAKTGELVSEVAHKCGEDINQPCGGQGRCGRCAVQVTTGSVRARSSLRLSKEDIDDGYVLACQSVIEQDVVVDIPPQEKIERRLTTDRTVAEVSPPPYYDPNSHQTLRRIWLAMPPPSMDDQTDDWSRIQAALRKQAGFSRISISLPLLRRISGILRESNWRVTALVNSKAWDSPDCPARMIDILPGHVPSEVPLWGAAIDIGTTTVTVWLTDLRTGEVMSQCAEYNSQITRGEDVISRIIYSAKDNGQDEMRSLVLGTINELLDRATKRARTKPDKVYKVTVSGNSTMMHLLLGLPASNIRLSPFITTVNHIPTQSAADVGLNIHPHAIVDCLPGVASYVGADISAGVLASEMQNSDEITLFMDVGTNGETVLGSKDWLVTCACSAGPAFEGAGVLHGMRATQGAIEEVWINSKTHEPTIRVIGGVKPKGVCGSGLISLLAELYMTRLLDKAGGINQDTDTPRVRFRDHGPEYVIAWADETSSGKDIVITNVDINNLLRAKAAIFAGFSVLAKSVGIPLSAVERMPIGGSFGRYINIEKAIQIGLLPDMPWEKFKFLGNTSVKGAYLALLDHNFRANIAEIAARMTYIELSADNRFYDAFMSALFLPHTDMSLFPTVHAEREKTKE